MLSFAQSQGECMFLKAESNIREMYLDYRTHTLEQMMLDYYDVTIQLLSESKEFNPYEQKWKEYDILLGKCLCRLGELEMYINIRSSKENYTYATELLKEVEIGVDLESNVMKLMFDVLLGNEIEGLDSIIESYSLRINDLEIEKDIGKEI